MYISGTYDAGDIVIGPTTHTTAGSADIFIAKYNTGGTDNNRDGQIDSNDRIRQFNNMFTFGLIFVLPPKTKTTD